jgi:hypothetical protein
MSFGIFSTTASGSTGISDLNGNYCIKTKGVISPAWNNQVPNQAYVPGYNKSTEMCLIGVPVSFFIPYSCIASDGERLFVATFGQKPLQSHYADYIIIGKTPVDTPNDTYGIKVYDQGGTLGFASNRKYVRLVQRFPATMTWLNSNTFNFLHPDKTKTLYFPTSVCAYLGSFVDQFYQGDYCLEFLKISETQMSLYHASHRVSPSVGVGDDLSGTYDYAYDYKFEFLSFQEI